MEIGGNDTVDDFLNSTITTELSTKSIFRNATVEGLFNSTMISTSANSTILSIEDYVEYEIGVNLWKYMSPVIIVLGVIGNILSFLVTTFTSMSQSNSSIYLSALAIFDTGALIIGLGQAWVLYMFDFDVRATHEWVCKFHVLFTYIFIDSSAWMLVCVTVDRVIFVSFPLKAKTICTRRRAIINISIVIFFIIGVNVQWIFTIGEVNNYKCYFLGGFLEFHTMIWPWIHTSMASFVPFTILIICNTVIVIQLLKIGNRRKKQLHVSNSKKDEETRSMTIMLVAISLLFLIFTSPVPLDIVIKLGTRKQAPTTLAEDAWKALTLAITHMLMYLNNALNFVMYCLSGKKFRDSLKELFCGRKFMYRGSTKTSMSRISQNLANSQMGLKTVTASVSVSSTDL